MVMEFLMKATTVLTALNIVFLLALGYIYVRNWLKLKTSFTSGLLLFNLLFLAQNLTSFYFYITMTPYFVDMVSLHVFILTLLQTIAFLILTIISWK